MKFLIAVQALIFCCICRANMLALPEVPEGQIRIDGAINTDEYAKTSMLGGMVHYVRTRMIPRDVEVYLARSPEKPRSRFWQTGMTMWAMMYDRLWRRRWPA